MRYISTRGSAPELGFADAILTGLATDGGLYVPKTIPVLSQERIDSWHGLDYQSLMFEVVQPFVQGDLADDDLRQLIANSYTEFRHTAMAPLIQTARNEWVLELFHGPTLAFKDFALQFVGQLLNYFLEQRNQRVVVLGATSGDTGSAAIAGCRNCDNIDIFILHPWQRISEVQRRQMTTVLDSNVHNIGIEGNFDDCQHLVKQCFLDQSFLSADRQLVAINSINWARIVAQIVYYFYAALGLGGPHRAVSFAVPTGNFGDIYAGYLARRMGLPIEQLIIGTNSNDILHRCLTANDHSMRQLIHTNSPSMDIMVSSNFERLLFDLYEQDGTTTAELLANFDSGSIRLSEEVLKRARQVFASSRFDNEQTRTVMQQVYAQTGYAVDPHTAIGIGAARECRRSRDTPIICMATAHPAKFPAAAEGILPEIETQLPLHLADLFEREERCHVIPKDLPELQNFISQTRV